MTTPANLRSRDVLSRSPGSALCYRKRLRKYQRRERVRKSLKFGEEKDEAQDELQPPRDGTAVNEERGSSCSTTGSSGPWTGESHTSPCFNFWNFPPAPPLPADDPGISVNRRSLRLRTKNQFPFAQISDSRSPNLSLGEPAPTSDQVLRSKSEFCLQSVQSDYGTASETSSLYFCASRNSVFASSSVNAISDSNTRLNLKGHSYQRQPKASSELSCSQSIGYASDLDDCLSNLSIDDAKKSSQELRLWDSDDNIEEEKISEWEAEINNPHLTLQEIDAKNLRAYLKTAHGINVLIPLYGYEILRAQKCIGRQSLGHPEQRRAIRYDLRRRPNPQLENMLNIEIFDDINIEKDFLEEGLRVFQVSPVISIQPHEVKFCNFFPAIVQIPLRTHPSTGDEVHCLYSRQCVDNLKDKSEKIPWKSVEAGKFSITNGRVNFETYDFGLFVLVIRPRCLFSSKKIRARVGGKLLFNDLPCVEVNFPKEATREEIINASAQIYFDTERSVSEVLARKNAKLIDPEADAMDEGVEPSCLATPIIHLEPHGIEFKGDPVLITLPVPDYDKIVASLGDKAKLSIYQSNTGINEPSSWEKLDVSYEICQSRQGGVCTTVIKFPVTHFSFFKGVWEALSSYLYDARIGMMYYFVSFAMKCQANMEEFIDGENKHTFGLEVVVFQADKPWPEVCNYKYKVGQSNPKLIKPGKIRVKLRSQYFGPDEAAGEEEMVKEEPDFRGRDFEKQFACRFKPDMSIERGPFGKVLVTRQVSSRQNGATIFDFNIQKHGNEADVAPPENNDGDLWSIVALTELASSLFITDGDNWKLFAKEIGMTKQEIKDAKLKISCDPFQKIVTHYRERRGGTAEEFVNAIYRCHRAVKVNGYSPDGSKNSPSSNGSSGRGSLSSNNVKFDRYGSHDSDTSGTQTSQDSGLHPKRRRPYQVAERNSGNPSVGSSNSKRRRLSERPTPSSSSDIEADKSDSDNDRVPSPVSSKNKVAIPGPSSGTTKASSIDVQSGVCRNDNSKLGQMFLWDISEHLNNPNWRALGRSLGLDESTLVDIDLVHRASVRECAYQVLLAWQSKFPSKCTFGTLYSALIKENMNSAAKKMVWIERNCPD